VYFNDLKQGETRAYSRKGNLHCVFPSALPGGNPDSDFHNSAAVDCIWVRSRKLFYVLDVLYWSLLPFTNCEVIYIAKLLNILIVNLYKKIRIRTYKQ